MYRKYRPHNFDNLVGQDHIKLTLTNALKAGRVSHAYLFTGPRGTGKTSTARLIAKALNCTNLTDNFEPCNECDFCRDISEGRLIDMIEIDAASNRGIDEVRDLKEKINFAPTRAKCKVYIIDEVHMMTKEAFNALLKTLEEPPAHAFFILATTEVHKIPETIISRCQRFDFRRITGKALMTRLSFIAQKEEIEAEDRALEAISKYVDGGLRDAIGLLEQLTVDKKLSFERVQDILGLSDFTLLEKLFQALMNDETKEALNIVDELHSQGSDLDQFMHEFVDLLRNKMLDSVMNDKPELTIKYIKMIEIFQRARQKLESDIPQLSLEIAVIESTGAKGDESVVEEMVKENEEPVPRKHKTIGKSASVTDDVDANANADTNTNTESRGSAAAVAPAVDLNLESISQNWPRVVERIKTPVLRMSLKNGRPMKLEGVELTLEFSTNFHKDKVAEHDNRVELESTIDETFGHPIKIIPTVKAIEIKSVVSDQSGNSSVIDEALEIFGGEII